LIVTEDVPVEEVEPVPLPDTLIDPLELFPAFPDEVPAVIAVLPVVPVATAPDPERFPEDAPVFVPVPELAVKAVVPLPPVVAAPVLPLFNPIAVAPALVLRPVLLPKATALPDPSVEFADNVPFVAIPIIAPELEEFPAAPRLPIVALDPPTDAVFAAPPPFIEDPLDPELNPAPDEVPAEIEVPALFVFKVLPDPDGRDNPVVPDEVEEPVPKTFPRFRRSAAAFCLNFAQFEKDEMHIKQISNEVILFI